eukprot:TRINITY_DN56863_c0_g1_i1.p1 TRINITY_DN56863_c0_g1~~TRINITY_DN56863_c0_g1_i1.p1  ORF type:complete len:347 (-),score=63.69 TRINITY_DN56863_c0_g1_i1:365-1342(-)
MSSDVQFSAVLQRFDNCRLGFSVGLCTKDGSLHVIDLSDGVASMLHATQNRCIQIGDVLLEINNLRDNPEQMAKELKNAKVLRLTFSRKADVPTADLRASASLASRETVDEGTRLAKQVLESLAEKEAIEEEIHKQKFAMMSLTLLPSTPDDALWQSAALWTLDRTFLDQDVGHLQSFGFPVASTREWEKGSGSGPKIQLEVEGHEERAGHTWYFVTCRLQDSDEAKWQVWTAPRRLQQLRCDLHDRLKNYDCDEEETYYNIFGETPFARIGGVPGTSARLMAWLRSLARAISTLQVSPAVVAYTLLFFHAPLPGQVMSTSEVDV